MIAGGHHEALPRSHRLTVIANDDKSLPYYLIHRSRRLQWMQSCGCWNRQPVQLKVQLKEPSEAMLTVATEAPAVVVPRQRRPATVRDQLRENV